MDPAPQKRVRDRKARPSIFKELSSSPSASSPQRRKKAGKSTPRPKTKKKGKKAKDRLWRLAEPAVLAEEQREDGRYLLLNWADDSETGEKFEPTWEKDTQAGVTDWPGRADKDGQQNTNRAGEQTTGSLSDSQDSDDSESVLTATRKRLVQGRRSTSRGHPVKRRRVGLNATTAASTTGQGSAGREIPDTYEYEQLSSSRRAGPEIRVEIPVPEDFDRSLYAVAPASVQSSSSPQGGISQSLPSSSRPPKPRQRAPFIWDEDIVVPDSLEQPDSSSYKTSNSALTRSSLPKDFGEASQRSSNSIGWGATPLNSTLRSQSVSDSLAEPQSFLSQASYQITSAFSIQNKSGFQSSGSISQSTAASKNLSKGESSASESPRSASRQIDASRPNFATQSSQNSTSSHHHRNNRQYFNHPNSIYSGTQSSSQYQTQLPFGPPHFSSSLISKNVNSLDQSQRLPPVSRQTHSRSALEHASRSKSAPRSVVSQAQRSQSTSKAAPSSFEATWAAAKVISSAPASAQISETSHRVASDLAPSKPVSQTTLQSLSRSIEDSAPAVLDTSQQSQSVSKGSGSHSKNSQGQQGQHSQSSHLPSPPSEDILPSIEKSLGNSPAPTRHATPPSSDVIGASSPIRPMSQSSGIDPAVKQEEAPYDSKAAFKQIMEAKRMKIRAEQEQRDRTLSTAPPSPAVNVPDAVAHQPVAVELNSRHLAPTTDEDAVITNGVDEPAHDDPSTSDLDQPSGGLNVITTKNNEFLVPLPMTATVRDVYNTAIREHKSLIKMLTRGDVGAFDEEKVEEIDTLLENLRRICDHQDTYNDGSSTQQSSTPVPMTNDEQARWAENCSTKCMFLATLLTRLKPQDEHVVIVARPTMIDILRYMCDYHGLSHKSDSSNEVSTSLKITLQPTGLQRSLVAPPSVVIAFGCNSEDLPLLKDLRSNTDAPLISLVVNHSIEHLDRCFADDIDLLQKKLLLVKCLQRLEGSMGQMTGEYKDPALAANAVAGYLENGAFSDSWPLPQMPEIEEIEVIPEDAQLKPDHDPSAGLENVSVELPQQVILQPGIKRQIEDIMDTGSPKRQRLTPAPGDTALDMDISHVSDSSHQSSALQGSIAEASAVRAGSSSSSNGRVSSLQNRIKILEKQLQEKESIEARLRQLNNELEAGRKDLMASIERITPKYQEALNDRGRFEHEINQTLVREAAANKRIQAQAAEITKLKEKNAATVLELTAARQAMAASTVPEVAEMAKLKEQVANLEADKERLQKTVTNLQSQTEYMRSSYQNAATKAGESASELQEAQAEIADLRTKADANTVRIHEIQRDSELVAHVSTIKRLRSENDDLERECERRGELLKAHTAKRVSSRNTPGPRSPRIGGAMSPMRPSNRNFRAGSAGGSRGNSPAPGDMFGGNLDGSAVRGGSVRWGTHLHE